MIVQKHSRDSQLGPWLALFHVPHLTLKTSHQLLANFGSPEKIFLCSSQEFLELGLNPKAIEAIQAYQSAPDTSEIGLALKADFEWLEKRRHSILYYGAPEYPDQLRQIPSPPLILYVIGDPCVLRQPQIAVVGSRNPSITGRDTAFAFAKHLSQSGITVTSGLAIGIDGSGHMGALEGGGPTVAVMATGADKLYPHRHRELAKKITENGVLISEFPLGTPPRPAYFPQRNRIISGLSLGVLVVEAALKSGSLITAKFAVTQDREVFAIPGSVHNPLSKGCHALIRQGAKLVETTEDILEEIQNMLPDNPSAACVEPTGIAGQLALDGQIKRIYELIGFDTINTDTMMANVSISISELSQLLIQLELLGYIKAVDGGFIRNINP